MARYYSDMVNQRTCVYRLYSDDDILVYVGMTMNPLGRWESHRRKPWWEFVERTELTWYPDRETAKDAERHAIYHEDPVFNVARPLECC